MSDMANKLRYGSAMHSQIKSALMARYRLSQGEMEQYHERWRKGEEMFQAYTPTTENDAIREDLRDDGKPQYTTMVIPFPYAMALTAHTYYASVFLSRSPIFQFSARHGEPEMMVQGVEALLDYQVTVGQMLAPLYVWLLDPLRYGIGIVANYWEEETVTVSEFTTIPETYLGIPIPGKTKRVKQTRQIPGYHGNKIFNVRPFDFVPDPRVPISKLQEGEFCGRVTEVGWNTILRGAESGKYFNIEALRRMRYRSKKESNDLGSPDNIFPDEGDTADTFDITDMGFVTLLELEVELEPKSWKLGTGGIPEKWIFTLANEEIVIEARPKGAWHNQFEYFAQEYEVNGYELAGRSMMDLSRPLGDTLTWLINTHFFNVRKALNDQLVVDPSKVVMKDVTDPNAGRIIRLKPAAYGSNVRDAVHQLAVADITQGHLRDAQLVIEMLQRVTGVNDNVMGAVNPGGRKTATEIRTSSSFGINRLKTNAEYMSAQAWGPLAQVLLQNTQQYYDQVKQFKIAGDAWPDGKTMVVSPEDVQGFFDFVPVDGTMPVDKFALSNLWKEIMMGMMKMPPLLQQYDVGKIFAYTAKLAGAKNIDQFRVDMQTPQQVEQNLADGKIVPIGEGNGSRGNGVGRSEEGFARPSGVGQVSGVGPGA